MSGEFESAELPDRIAVADLEACGLSRIFFVLRCLTQYGVMENAAFRRCAIASHAAPYVMIGGTLSMNGAADARRLRGSSTKRGGERYAWNSSARVRP